jgi:hypothetical protein
MGRAFGRVLLTHLICRLTDFFEAGDLVGLGTLCSLDDIELHLIAFFQALVPLALDGAVVDEDVRPALAAEEAVALRVVEPLNCALVLCQWSDSLVFRVCAIACREVKVLQR